MVSVRKKFLPSRPGYHRMILVTTAIGMFLIIMSGCFPSVKLLPDAADPLKEYVLEGDGRDKVAVININGVISHKVHRDIMSREVPSLLQEVIAQLKMAEQDPAVKAVVFKIDSPGGSVTASDILYQRILDFKETTGAKVVAVTQNEAEAAEPVLEAVPEEDDED